MFSAFSIFNAASADSALILKPRGFIQQCNMEVLNELIYSYILEYNNPSNNFWPHDGRATAVQPQSHDDE